MTHFQINSRFLSILLLLVVVASSLVLTGCSRELDASSSNATPATPVVLADVVETARAMPIRTSGRLSAKKEQKLSFKIGGLIAYMAVDEGATVRRGTVLAQLNMAEIDAQVLQAESAVAKAQRDLERAEGLLADSVATLEQTQDARTALEVAEANLRIAQFNRQHAVIRAPSSGKVLRRLSEDDELVGAGAPVFLFGANREGWVVRVGLADRDIVNVALGDEASIQFDAFPDSLIAGRVTEIASAADPYSGTFEVEIALENPAVPLRSGFIARVDILPSHGETYRFVPIAALVEGNGTEGTMFTYDAASGEATKVTVEIARILDEEVATSAGLENHNQVIVDGAAYLKDGDPVTATN